MYSTVRFTRPLLLSLLIFAISTTAAAQTFNATPYNVGAGPLSLVRADFNNDGFADLATSNGDGSVTILLNNGSGTFRRLDAVNSTSASGNIVAADLNHDHFIDLVVIGASGTVNVLYGRGDGTFNPPSTAATRPGVEQVAVADFNGDGNIDIAYAWNSSNVSPSSANVTILYGNGSNGWTAKDFTNLGAQADVANGESSYRVTKLVAGDFNGDGKADFAFAECCGGFDVEVGAAYVYTNTGTSFTGTSLGGLPPNEMSTADVGQDGRLDLLISGNGCHTPCTELAVYENLPTSPNVHAVPDPNASNRETDRYESGAAGDFLNTGVKMVAYSTLGFDFSGTGSESGMLSFASRNPDGSYGAPNSFSTGDNLLYSLVTGDFNHDGKLDLAGVARSASFGNDPNQVIVYTNTTSSAEACAAGSARTVNVCSPGSSSTNPVRFLATPFSTTAISGMKIYVDNTSVFYTPDDRISTLLSLSAGTHSVVVKAWDTAGPFSKSFTLTVGSGGGSSCSATSNRMVKICSPVAGSTVSSPVQVLAGLRSDSGISASQIYLDGVKVYQAGAGTTTVNQSLSMSAGSHRITVKGWDSAGSFSSSVTITVGASSSSSCTVSANRTVHICSPTSGSTVSSPVRVLAGLRSDSGISAGQIYLDGTKIYQYPAGTKTIDQSISMAGGSHRITVKGWDSSGSFSSSVSITVQ